MSLDLPYRPRRPSRRPRYFTVPQSALIHFPVIVASTVIVLPCSLFDDFMVPLKLVGDSASTCICIAMGRWPVHTTLASRTERVLVVTVCLHVIPTSSAIMKFDLSNVSLVTHVFIVL